MSDIDIIIVVVVKFQVVMAVCMKMTASRDIAPCRLIEAD
jgi:hypothetical protein